MFIKRWLAVIGIAYKHTSNGSEQDSKLILELMTTVETKDGFVSKEYEQEATEIRCSVIEGMLN